ncbi:MAG: hypothetical protein R3349_08955, partial [Geminicoccaceae bacterium]|nr:hypothetical protein [Geminicoccaceae bacterium]
MRRLVLIASLLGLTTFTQVGHALTLAPGEPLTGPAVERLVDDALVLDTDGRLRIEIEEPRLP